MKTSITKDKLPKPALIATSAFFWIAVWYLAAFLIGSELFLPYPHSVMKAFFSLTVQSKFWLSILRTMLTVMSGCVIGCLVGILFAALSSLSSLAKSILAPLVMLLRATPVASIIILVYVIVRKIKMPVNTVSVLIVIFMVIPILYSNLSTGIASLDPRLNEVASIYRFSFAKKLSVLWLPQLKSHLLSGVTSALGFAWKSGVATEVICNLPNTIGKHLADTKSTLEMDDLFAWTFTVVMLSMLFEFVFKRLFLPQEQKGVQANDSDQ